MRLDIDNCLQELVNFGVARHAGIEGDLRYTFQQPASPAARDLVERFRERRVPVGPEDRSPSVQRFREMIGRDEKMLVVFEWIRTAAKSDISVLILGPTGSGKEVVARMIHELSRRGSNRLQTVTCAALPETLFESEVFGYEKGAFTGAHERKAGRLELANRGTLFLDEVGDLSLLAQAKLLRALEERRFERLGGNEPIDVDFRLVSSTNKPLDQCVRDGLFREDLYYRIAVLEIQIPPLRERPTDIPALVHHRLCIEQELAGCNEPYQIERLALKALTLYEWPGNIRELQNIISRLAARANTERPITQTDVLSQLPQEAIDYGSLLLPTTARVINPDEDLHAFIARIQLLAIESTVKATGNATNAAYRLGYGRTSLLALKNNLRKGIHRRTKRTSPSPTNPNQPLLPVD
jgi:transcriptional regulator with PAS, ATPase and Fis domain